MSAPDVRQIGNRWQVVRLIGQGGMSWVFEVIDPRLGVPRALKMLKPAAANSAGYKSFLREAQILARMEDDFLVRIYDLDKDPVTGNDYYVMELLSGMDLKQSLRRNGPFAAARAVDVFAGVLQALGKLHAESPPIIHRDIKPANIQITDSGRPKLLDLGIAKVTRKNAEETVFGDDSTVADMFKGTVLYASPEHLAMQEIGPQSDVFGMGLCLYEALEGHHAYSGVEGLPDPTSSHVLYQDVFRFYTRLEAIQGSLKVEFKRAPKPYQAVIRKALEIEPRRRFQDANEMRLALLNPDTVTARTTQEPGAARRIVRQQPLVPKPPPQHLRDGDSRVREEDARGREEDSRGHDEDAEREPAQVAAPPLGRASWKLALGGAAIAACLGAAVYLSWPPDTKPTQAEAIADRAERDPAPVPPAPVPTPQEELEKPTEDPAQSARLAQEEAEGVNAELNAPDAWQRGVSSLAASDWDSATEALREAGFQARAALEEAQRAQAAAKASRLRARDCSSVGGGIVTCRDADRQIARGDSLLKENDAPGARAAFERAQQLLAIAPKVAFELSVQPRGPVVVEVGKVQRFQATTKPPGATIRYSVQPPSGAQPYAASGTSYAFVPGIEGDYRITVTATDARKKQAAPVVILARATPTVAAPNVAPELELEPASDRLAGKVGVAVELRAIATDRDGGKPGVRFTVNKPKEAPAIPNNLTDVGNARVLHFTPTVAGPYTFTFWAIDAEGQSSERKTVTLVVAREAETDEGAALLREFKIAIETRNMNRLKAIWRIDAESADGFQHLFDNADDIKVVAEPLGTIQLRGADRGSLRFRQRVTTTMQGETQDIVPLAPYRAELVRQHDGWRIIELRQE